MIRCGSRPCPICEATGTDVDGSRCPACLGTAPWIPFPWVQPGDEQEPQKYALWSTEESAIVTAAPSLRLAIIGHYGVYGPTRTTQSIQFHRLRIAHDPSKRPLFPEAAIEAIQDAPTAVDAIYAVRAVCPDIDAPERAICTAWRACRRYCRDDMT